MTIHRKRIKHYHEPGDLHEFTFSCYHRWPLLTNDLWRKTLSKHITNSLSKHRFQLVAFVYMPEHVHLLTFPLDPEPEIDQFLAHLKQPYSEEIHELLKASKASLLKRLIIRERPGRMVFRYWQEGPGFDRNLFTPQAVQACIDYIRNNPVVRKLCKRAVDWKWSSARRYLLPGASVDFDLPPITPLPAEFWTGSRVAQRF
jgi:putative transposase